MPKRLLIFVALAVALLTITTGVRPQATFPVPAQQTPVPGRSYVGSSTCGDCHVSIYQRWAKTRMANVVTDPKVKPQVVIPDFSKPDPLLTFKLEDVAFVYGTKWKQRYFKKVGNDYFPLPAQWDVNHKIWRAVLRAAEHGLVGALLSGRQYEAADGSFMRRLPFCELRHQNENRHRMECGV